MLKLKSCIAVSRTAPIIPTAIITMETKSLEQVSTATEAFTATTITITTKPLEIISTSTATETFITTTFGVMETQSVVVTDNLITQSTISPTVTLLSTDDTSSTRLMLMIIGVLVSLLIVSGIIYSTVLYIYIQKR